MSKLFDKNGNVNVKEVNKKITEKTKPESVKKEAKPKAKKAAVAKVEKPKAKHIAQDFSLSKSGY